MKDSIRLYTSSQEVLDNVKLRLKTYFDSDLIIIEDYYRYIGWCNQKLGLRVNEVKEDIIDLNNYTAILPRDFLLLNVALLTNKRTVIRNYDTLTTTTETSIEDDCNTCHVSCQSTNTNVTVKKVTDKFSIQYDDFSTISLKTKRYISDKCFNIYANSPYFIDIDRERGIIVSEGVEKGHIYLNYLSNMLDKDGLPLCIDNPLFLKFYEDTLVYYILIDLFTNKRLEIANAIKVAEGEMIKSKMDALSVASMPEFNEMKDIRKFLVKRYNKLFKRI